MSGLAKALWTQGIWKEVHLHATMLATSSTTVTGPTICHESFEKLLVLIIAQCGLYR